MTETRDWSAFVLLLIDMQSDSWEPAFNEAFPDYCQRVRELLAFCRANGIEVVHIRAEFAPDRSDWMAPYIVKGRIPYRCGTPGVETLPYAAPIAGEQVFVKHTFDAFCDPALEAYLRERGTRFVLTAGLLTSVCVLFTTVSAMQRGFMVAVVEDCCADAPAVHAQTLDHYEPIFLNRVYVEDLAARQADWLCDLATLHAAR